MSTELWKLYYTQLLPACVTKLGLGDIGKKVNHDLLWYLADDN